MFVCLFVRVTREHREMLVKLAKQNTNKAKENLRKVRTNAMNKLKKSKDKTSEDTIRLIEKQVLLPTDGASVYLTHGICVLMPEALKAECSGHLIHMIRPRLYTKTSSIQY